MKKNKTMRLASGLLVAVLLTTCAISGTFAKYVSDATNSDTARVAKWSIEVEGEEIGVAGDPVVAFDLFETVRILPVLMKQMLKLARETNTSSLLEHLVLLQLILQTNLK